MNLSGNQEIPWHQYYNNPLPCQLSFFSLILLSNLAELLTDLLVSFSLRCLLCLKHLCAFLKKFLP